MKPLRTTLQTRWQTLTARLSARERTLVSIAALLLGAFLLWSLAIAPAWRTVQQAEARQQALDRNWQTLRSLQAEAQALRTHAARPAADLLQALSQSLAPLNAGAGSSAASTTTGNANTTASAQLQRQADQAVLTLRQVPATALAAWLAQLRAQGLPAPTQAQLQRAPSPTGASSGVAPGTEVRWSGTLHFQLPAN